MVFRLIVGAIACGGLATELSAAPIRVLFLGDKQGHHVPAERYQQIVPILKERGFELKYTDEMTDLSPKTLAGFDVLLVYANIDTIEPDQARALLDFVAGGKGFVPIHCASYCFRNSDAVVGLIGGQFLRHGTGTVRDSIVVPDHPVMKGYDGFESWDETYVHTKHNLKDRVVLAERIDGDTREPWTWVRSHGKGRVFYTAWGHDARTWGNPGFQNLLERGIRWAAGADPSAAGAFRDQALVDIPAMNPKRTDVKAFQYKQEKVAYYPPSGQRRGDGAWNAMQLPVDAAESMKHLVVPKGFEVELFAAEPEINKPLCMNWDERGRLWIAETVDYPNNLQPRGRGADRIKICEDTDGDGRADKFTVFADGLSIPTSLVFYRGGVIVHQAPDTLFLKDTNGDGRADERKTLFSGWGTRDTHAGPSNLRWGFDNWIWGIVGYSGFEGTVGGESFRFSQGFYRFRPDGSRLEFLRSTNNNSWGVGFSEEGIVFGSTANRNPSVYLAIPNRYYESVRGRSSSVLGGIADTHLFKAITDKVRQVDHHGGYTAAAGHALYTARTYPKSYWNRTAFVAEPTGHLVGTFVLTREGSDFHSRNLFNLLASDDEWTAPTMAEVGPDGHVWVIDWYNYIVQHNPTPVGFQTGKGGAYESELRDKSHGRIYRVVDRSAPKSRPFSLEGASPAALVATLANPNLLWRLHAQRLLVESGDRDVVPALRTLVENHDLDAIGLNPGAIHAIWTLHGLGVLDGQDRDSTSVVEKALAHPSAGVRMNAAKVLPATAQSVQAILSAKLLEDADAQVRLAALLALADLPAVDAAGSAIASLLANPSNVDDRWIPDAATAAAAKNAPSFLKAIATGREWPSKTLPIVTTVARHYARGGPTDSAAELAQGLLRADRRAAEAILAGLATGWPQGRSAAIEPNLKKSLLEWSGTVSLTSQAHLVSLFRQWNNAGADELSQRIVARMVRAVGDETVEEARRIGFAREVVALRPDDREVVGQLLEVVSPRSSPSLASGIIGALEQSKSGDLGPALVRRMNGLTPSAKAAAIRILLSQSKGTEALLDGAEGGRFALSELSLDQKQTLSEHRDARLRARARALLAKGGGLPNADRQKVIDELSSRVLQRGDAVLGKQVFVQQCAKCHSHGGEGGKVGPDLTGMAVHPKEELLVHILDPSRSVEGNFRQYTIATKDGRVLNGVLTSESKTAIELTDAEGKLHEVQRSDVDDLTVSSKSLMPDGFEKQVSAEAIANLLEFLTKRGKFLPLDLTAAATAVSTRGMFVSEDNDVERLIFPDWAPKSFAGVPFQLVDPKGGRVPNVVLLNGPSGYLPPKMPRSVNLPCNTPAKAIHFLSGVSGWGFPIGERGSVSMIVRLVYANGKTENHPLKNGVEFADYIRPVEVPGSKLAFRLRGQQIRYFSVTPKSSAKIDRIELLKGADATAPVVMAVTAELSD